MKDKNPRALQYMQKVQRGMNNWREKLGNPQFNSEHFQLEEVEVIIPKLNPAFEGYRLANISDIHLGQWITPKHLHGVVKLINMRNQIP